MSETTETREEREARWWAAWFAEDYSWEGLKGKFIEGGGQFGEKTLQDYWRYDPEADEKRTDAELKAAGELEEFDGRWWHIAHLPPRGQGGDESWKADLGASEWARLDAQIAMRLTVAVEIPGAFEVAGDGWRSTSGASDGRAILDGTILGPASIHSDDEVSPILASCRRAAFLGANDFAGVTFGLHADFSGAVFSGDASFYSATFSGDASFDHATFLGGASFDRATFSGDACLNSATFSGNARFESATFLSNTNFNNATFSGFAEFQKVISKSGFNFNGAAFLRGADFGGATFSGGADFFCANFSGLAYIAASFSGAINFSNATFVGGAGFNSATFSGSVYFESAVLGGAGFESATFSGDVSFNNARFSDRAGFNNATFSGEAYFDSVTFSGAVSFNGATFSDFVGFNSTKFVNFTSFSRARFQADAHFQGAEFASVIYFSRTEFLANVSFYSALFFGVANFNGVVFSGVARFNRAAFSSVARFKSATFSSNARFNRAVFSRNVRFDRTRFVAGAIFDGAVFYARARFAHAEFEKDFTVSGTFEESSVVDFSRAVFNGLVRFAASVTAPAKSFHRAFYLTQFLAPVEFDGAVASGQAGRLACAFVETIFKDKVILDDGAERDARQYFRLHMLPEALGADDAERNARLRALEAGCRTLKVVMDVGKDELRQQRYYRFQLMARQRRSDTEGWERAFGRLYGWTSDYGSSFSRPLALLLAMIVAFGLVYWGLGVFGPAPMAWRPLLLAVAVAGIGWSAAKEGADEAALTGFMIGQGAIVLLIAALVGGDPVWQGQKMALSAVFRPFATLAEQASAAVSADASNGAREWPHVAKLGLHVITTIQSLLSGVLIFLFGLAVKRRFQIS